MLRALVFLAAVFLGGSDRIWLVLAAFALAAWVAYPFLPRYLHAGAVVAAWGVLASAWSVVGGQQGDWEPLVLAAALALVVAAERGRWRPRVEPALARAGTWIEREIVPLGAVFLLVASLVSFYGQLNRKQAGDTYALVYTAVAIARDGTVQLDRFLPVIQERAGERPGQVEESDDGHFYSHFPIAPSLAAVPAVGALALAGVPPGDWDAHMEAGHLTGSLLAAIAVALFFLLLTRLTTPGRAFVVAAIFAWGTMIWTVAGQGLWGHSLAVLALVAALYALVTERWALAGLALSTMVAARPSTALVALLLAPLLVRRPYAPLWALLGALPPALAVAWFNTAAYGCITCTGYSDDLGTEAGFSGPLVEGLLGNTVSPGRSIFVYSPVLLLSIAGGVLAWRRRLYLCAALAVVAHVLLLSKWFEWWGGEVFGPRQLVDVLPLFALLLVPALDRWRASRDFVWLFGALAGLSVLIHLLGAGMWTSTLWYDLHDVRSFGSWWDPTDTEVVALFSDAERLVTRGGAMAAIVALALAAGWLATRIAATVRAPSAPVPLAD